MIFLECNLCILLQHISIKILNTWTLNTLMVLKMERCGFTMQKYIYMQVEWQTM